MPVERVKVVPHFIVVQVSPPVAPEVLEPQDGKEAQDVDMETTEKHLGHGLVAEAAASRRPPLSLGASLQVEREVIVLDPELEGDSKLLLASVEPASIAEEHELVGAVTVERAGDDEEAPDSEERAVVAASDPRAELTRQNVAVVAGQVLQSVGPIGTQREFEDVVCLILEEFEPIIQSVEQLVEVQDWVCAFIDKPTSSVAQFGQF